MMVLVYTMVVTDPTATNYNAAASNIGCDAFWFY